MILVGLISELKSLVDQWLTIDSILRRWGYEIVVLPHFVSKFLCGFSPKSFDGSILVQLWIFLVILVPISLK